MKWKQELDGKDKEIVNVREEEEKVDRQTERLKNKNEEQMRKISQDWDLLFKRGDEFQERRMDKEDLIGMERRFVNILGRLRYVDKMMNSYKNRDEGKRMQIKAFLEANEKDIEEIGKMIEDMRSDGRI